MALVASTSEVSSWTLLRFDFDESTSPRLHLEHEAKVRWERVEHLAK